MLAISTVYYEQDRIDGDPWSAEEPQPLLEKRSLRNLMASVSQNTLYHPPRE